MPSNLGAGEILLLFILIIVWFIVLLDILKNEFKENNKIVWILIVIFIPVIGAILYLIIGRGQKI